MPIMIPMIGSLRRMESLTVRSRSRILPMMKAWKPMYKSVPLLLLVLSDEEQRSLPDGNLSMTPPTQEPTVVAITSAQVVDNVILNGIPVEDSSALLVDHSCSQLS